KSSRPWAVLPNAFGVKKPGRFQLHELVRGSFPSLALGLGQSTERRALSEPERQRGKCTPYAKLTPAFPVGIESWIFFEIWVLELGFSGPSGKSEIYGKNGCYPVGPLV